MELQWELMIFTLFISLGSGIFAWQGVLAWQGRGKHIQLSALITSLVCIGIGGIGSFLHLNHWERIFNGFGHLTSGITQELIGIVVFVIALFVYFVAMRRSDGNIPKWCGVMAVIIAAALVFVMGQSYDMAARPVWHTLLLPMFYLSNGAFFGAIVVLIINEVKGADSEVRKALIKYALICGAVQLVLTIVYIAFISTSAGSFSTVGNYFDPTTPTKEIIEPSEVVTSIVTGSYAPIFWLGVIAVGLGVPGVLLFLLWKDKFINKTLVIASISVIAALIGGMCFRVLIYLVGMSVFLYF